MTMQADNDHHAEIFADLPLLVATPAGTHRAGAITP